MATINLGSIKFNWRGAYAGGTAYAVDDVVSYNGSSYICILASTGNLPTNATYFEQMSSKGTDADLLNIASTAQGDLYYNNGSAIARLGAGTSGQVLQTGGTGANPNWGTVSSDYVKIASTHTTSGTASTINYQNIFDDAVYGGYIVYWNVNSTAGGSGGLTARFLNGSTAYSGSADYRRAGYHSYRRTDNTENAQSTNNDGDGTTSMNLEGWSNNPSFNTFGSIHISGNLNESTNFPAKMIQNWVVGRDSSNPDYIYGDAYFFIFDQGNVNGIQFFRGSAMEKVSINIWGLKK